MKLVELIKEYYNNSWEEFIYNERVLKELENIESKIGREYYPLSEDIFKFLKSDLNNVKYIIFGMDPYLGKNEDGKPLQLEELLKYVDMMIGERRQENYPYKIY